MKTTKHKFCGLIAGLALASLPMYGAAINGVIYQNIISGDASVLPPSSLPHASFTTTNISYNSISTGYTPAAFLNGVTFTNVMNGFNPTGNLGDTFFEFTGQVALVAGPNTFSVAHDDNAQLTITGLGTIVNQNAPNDPGNPFIVSSPTTGLFNFTLNYIENPYPPALLSFQVNGAPVGGISGGSTNTTPEPVSMALTGTALVGLGVLARRRKNC